MRLDLSVTSLALAAVLASPARAAEHLVFQDKGTTEVFAELKGDHLVLRSVGPSAVFVSYDVDADGDGRINPSVDVSYNQNEDGSLCAAKWISDNKISACGGARTAAHAWQEVGSDHATRYLDAPLAELSRNGREIRMRVVSYERGGKTHARQWLAYDLASGKATLIADPGKAAESPAAAPTPTQLTTRHDAGEEWMSRVCAYDQLPGIRLMLHSLDGRFGEFMVRPAESDSIYNNQFRFRLFPTGRINFNLVVSHNRYRPAKVASAVLLADGQAFDLRPIQPFDSISANPITYKPYVSFEQLPSAAIAALARARTAELMLTNTQGEISRWTYPMENFRYLRPAMEASGWKCNQAW